ncbi:MAG: PAS domain S-box protein, partial [Calditrichaeota bacterium]
MNGYKNKPSLEALLHQLEQLQHALKEKDRALATEKEKLEQANKELQKMRRALEKEKKNLERKVQQRTRQLNQLNKALEKELAERVQTQQALEESELKYRTLIEHSNDAIYVIQDNRFVLVNKRFSELFGFQPEEVLGRDFRQFIAPESQAAIEERMHRRQSGQTVAPVFEFSALNKEKQPVLCEASVASISYEGKPAIQGVVRDITERRLLERQLQQAQKLEAIGRLAGGVAHDFNNLLTVIRVYTQMLMGRLEPGDPIYEDLARIQQAEEKAARLTSQLLAFSRRQIRKPVVLNLNHLIADLTRMLRRIIGEDVELNHILATDLWHVRADLGQMEQLIMNLVINARDAMP